MRLKTFQEALASELFIISGKSEDASTGQTVDTEKKAIPSDLYAVFKGRNSDSVLGLQNYDEYLSLVCSMLNSGLSPSPSPFDDKASAIAAAANPKTQKALKNLLDSVSTHVLKFVDAGLPGESLINRIPSAGHGTGVSIDTISGDTVYSMGRNAADLFAAPYWRSKFAMPSGVVTSNFEVLMFDTDPQLKAWLEQALIDLGVATLYGEFLEVIEKFKNDPIAEVHGKLVRFPLGDGEYLAISPVPSATLLMKMSDRYFEAVRERVVVPKADRDAHTFNFPASSIAKVGGANSQNCGTVGVDLSGNSRALMALISDLPQGGNGSSEGRLLRKLMSGNQTLLAFPTHIIKYLRTTPEVTKHRRNWERYMTEAIAESMNDLHALRNEGLPIDADKARFRFPIERDFVFKKLAGDQAGRSMTPADLHALAIHVRDQFLYAARSSNHSLALSQSQADLIYQVAIEHIR